MQSKETVRVAFQISTVRFPEMFQELRETEKITARTSQTFHQHCQTVIIELMDSRTKSPVSVLEVKIIPQPAIIDHTIRFHGAEREHINQIIPIDNSVLSQAQETGLGIDKQYDTLYAQSTCRFWILIATSMIH